MKLSLRWSGIAPIVGSVIGLLITPMFSLAYFRAYGGGENPPPWLTVLEEPLEPLLDFDFARIVYARYGQIFIIVFVGALIGMLALRLLRGGGTTNRERWGHWVSIAGIILAGLGTAGDYATPQDSFWIGIGFMLENIGLLVLTAGSILLGSAMRRQGFAPRWLGWLINVGGPAGILAGVVLTAHIPAGPTFGYNFVWIGLGIALLRGQIITPLPGENI